MKKPAQSSLAAAAVVLGGILLTRGSPSAQTNDEVLRRLVGVWQLTNWTERLADGTTRQHPVSAGYIIYSDTGRVCAVVMDPNRPNWASATPTAEEASSGLSGRAFYAYCAKAELHADEGYVLHHTIIDKVPNAVGAVRKRWFELETPDRLVLKIDPPELPASVVESRLIWERVRD